MDKESLFMPSRLKVARKIAGLSLEDLSRKIDGRVTRQALSKYEQGKMSPSPEILNRLEQVLDLKPRYCDTPWAASGAERAGGLKVSGDGGGFAAERDGGSHGYPCGDEEKERRSSLWSGRSNEATIEIRGVSSPAPHGQRVPHAPCAPLPPDAMSYLEFRTSAPLPKKSEEALKHLALEYLARYEDLERLLGRVIVFRNPVAGFSTRTAEEIERAAETVRGHWHLGLSPVPNFLELLESNGIKVFEIRDMDGLGDFDGLAARSAGGYVIALNMNRPPDRIRFTAAHELAHIVCDFDGDGEKERLCHIFAGALLLPRPALERELVHRRRKLTLWELGAIKRKYGISLQAIMYRACGLGLIAPRHLRDFVAAVKKNGWTIDEPVAYQGREEAIRFKRLLNYAVAERIIGMEQAAALAGTTEAKLQEELGTML
ncbi:MAG: hypothetical protein BWX98_01523 [Candidatus Aminicenantes bacterium ADurb.Bin147]|nr:MAG: hypothetical protein BWX98_01523 [Candidatus Aminicenantes bacterium ADurb.Bin147]